MTITKDLINNREWLCSLDYSASGCGERDGEDFEWKLSCLYFNTNYIYINHYSVNLFMSAKISAEESKNLCQNCTLCCDYATIKLSAPKTKDDIDYIRWLLLHKITIFTEFNKDWYAKIWTKCRALSADGHCTIYATRPDVCRGYSHSACERYKGKDYIKETHIFNTEQEFMDFVITDKKLSKAYAKK